MTSLKHVYDTNYGIKDYMAHMHKTFIFSLCIDCNIHNIL